MFLQIFEAAIFYQWQKRYFYCNTFVHYKDWFIFVTHYNSALCCKSDETNYYYYYLFIYAPMKVNPEEGGSAGNIWGFDSKYVPFGRGFDRQFCHLDNNLLFSLLFFYVIWSKIAFPPWGIWQFFKDFVQIPTLCPHSPPPSGFTLIGALKCHSTYIHYITVIYVTKVKRMKKGTIRCTIFGFLLDNIKLQTIWFCASLDNHSHFCVGIPVFPLHKLHPLPPVVGTGGFTLHKNFLCTMYTNCTSPPPCVVGIGVFTLYMYNVTSLFYSSWSSWNIWWWKCLQNDTICKLLA